MCSSITQHGWVTYASNTGNGLQLHAFQTTAISQGLGKSDNMHSFLPREIEETKSPPLPLPLPAPLPLPDTYLALQPSLKPAGARVQPLSKPSS
jgi:hypothetical protein